MSGSFFNPDNDGTGLSFEILSDSFGIANWYTYDLEAKQRWHLRLDIGADGRLSGPGPGGCRYFGTARPIDPRFNTATARLLPANCFDVDGTVELTLIQGEGALLVLASGDQFYFDIWRR